jgi:hypothetical protein
VARPAEDALADRVDRHRACEHHGDKRVRERVSADVLQAVIDLDARHLRVVEDQRRAEFREDPDENDRAAREQAGVDERQRDPAEAPQARAAEVLGRLLHGRVDVRQRGDGIKVDDRVERERLDHSDAPELVRREPVERPAAGPEAQVDQECVHGPVLAEDLLDAYCPDEGRKDHGDQDRGI